MKAMKVLQQLIFTFAMVIGLSFAVCAQKDQQKPIKPPPPVITPQPKPPPDDKKPKKPSSYEAVWKIETRETA